MRRGQRGEGITGTTIKDTWTKSRGRLEAEREVGSARVRWRDGEKRQPTVIERQYKILKKEIIKHGTPKTKSAQFNAF